MPFVDFVNILLYNVKTGEGKDGVMTNQEYGKIIAKNLKRILYDSGKTQAEVAKELNINKATLSSWMTGTRVPKMSKIDLLCHYFNVSRVDIMEDKNGYYETAQTAKAAQGLYDSDLRALMDAARDCPPEVIRSTTDLLRRFKETNPDG